MSAMPFEDFESGYETLAMAIDSAGAEREALFLTRLALVLGHEPLRLRDVAVITYPDGARDAPPVGRCLVVADPAGVEKTAHVVGLVVGHVTQIEQELRHGGMIAEARARSAERSSPQV